MSDSWILPQTTIHHPSYTEISWGLSHTSNGPGQVDWDLWGGTGQHRGGSFYSSSGAVHRNQGREPLLLCFPIYGPWISNLLEVQNFSSPRVSDLLDQNLHFNKVPHIILSVPLDKASQKKKRQQSVIFVLM